MDEQHSSKPSDSPATGEPGDAHEKTSSKPAQSPLMAELRKLAKRAQKGEAEALPRIREILDEHPEVWEYVGNLTALVERTWIGLAAGTNALVVESLKRTIEEMRANLSGEHPTALETMLVDQVIACWLETKNTETDVAVPETTTVQHAAFRMKKLESAQKRYLAAIRMLTETRALLPTGLVPAPTIKLHGGERQQA